MKRGFVLSAVAVLAFAAGFLALAVAPPAPRPELPPSLTALDKAQEDVAALLLRTIALPAGERRNAEKLLKDASSRLDDVRETLPTVNPRLVKYLQNETRVAKTRIEDARKIVEQGSNQ